MRATYIYGAGDIRVINVPDPAIQQPTDAIVRVVRACIAVCSRSWPGTGWQGSHSYPEAVRRSHGALAAPQPSTDHHPRADNPHLVSR
jgi:hypothetical protein